MKRKAANAERPAPDLRPNLNTHVLDAAARKARLLGPLEWVYRLSKNLSDLLHAPRDHRATPFVEPLLHVWFAARDAALDAAGKDENLRAALMSLYGILGGPDNASTRVEWIATNPAEFDGAVAILRQCVALAAVQQNPQNRAATEMLMNDALDDIDLAILRAGSKCKAAETIYTLAIDAEHDRDTVSDRLPKLLALGLIGKTPAKRSKYLTTNAGKARLAPVQ